MLLDLFPHGEQPPSPPLVTLPGHHCESHVEEVAPFPVTEHLQTDEGSDPCTIQSPLSPAGLWSVPMHLAFSCLGTIVSVGGQSPAPSLALSCPWQLLSSCSILLSDWFTCCLHPHLILPCPAPPQCHHGLGGQRTEGERRQERLRQQEDAWLPRERPSPHSAEQGVWQALCSQGPVSLHQAPPSHANCGALRLPSTFIQD